MSHWVTKYCGSPPKIGLRRKRVAQLRGCSLWRADCLCRGTRGRYAGGLRDLARRWVMKILLVAIVLGLSACSSDGDDASGSSQGALDAPMLMEVVPMEGALHVRWMNMQTDASAVEAERRMD